MRKLSAAAQEERRRQVVGLRQRGLAYRAIAEQTGLSRTGVIDICQRFAAEGTKGLVSKPRGRRPEEQRRDRPKHGGATVAARKIWGRQWSGG